MEYAQEKVDVERSVYDWVIPDFDEVFQVLHQKKKGAHTGRRNGKEKRADTSDIELVSETFMRGQLVQRTCIWQVELRRNGTYLCVGLSCLECFHENLDEIWTRFDIDIVDFNKEVIHSQGAGVHFCSDNITRFVPLTKLGNKTEVRANIRCSFWETDAIAMNDLKKNWEKLVPRNILSLRLRLYIYQNKPFDEASHFAEYDEPVDLRYTDSSQASFSNPLLDAVKILWDTREDADVTFKVNGEEVKAHKFVISAQSPVLRRDVMMNAVAPIEITETCPSAFQQLLKYLYIHDISDLKKATDVSCITSVLDLSNRFVIPSLTRICLVRLITNMTVENFAETAFAVFSKVPMKDSFFKTEIKKFFMKNQKELRHSDAFQKMALDKTNQDVFLQICFQPLKIFKNSATPTN